LTDVQMTSIIENNNKRRWREE